VADLPMPAQPRPVISRKANGKINAEVSQTDTVTGQTNANED
jgi:hypothetical protein